MSSSKPVAQSTTIQSKDPWVVQQPYLTTGFARAQADVLETPITQFPASTVVPFSGQTEAGLQAAEALAAGGNPLVDAATQQLGQTIQGDYLNANPFFDAAVSAATTSATTSIATLPVPNASVTALPYCCSTSIVAGCVT